MDALGLTFLALSDPTRRVILGRLRTGSATVTQLSEPFGISQQAISKHLAYLERANLIEKKREGRQHFCSLRPAALKEACSWMDEYRRLWDDRFDQLDVFLKELQERTPQEKRKNVRKKR